MNMWMGCVANVSPRVFAALLNPAPDHRGEEFTPLQNRIINKVKQVMQTKNDIVLFTSSGTGGVEAIEKNIFRPGDNIIVPVFGLFSGVLCGWVEHAGANLIKVEAPIGEEPSIEQIEDAFKKYKKIKAVFTVFDETATGVTVTWFKELGELCKKYDAFFCVDAHAIFGALDLPVDKFGIDVCAGVSQIGMGGFTGQCYLSASKKAKDFAFKNPPKTTYFSIPHYLRWHSVGQPAFTPATEIMLAADEALDMVLEEGLQKRFKRCEIAAKAFYAAFDSMGVQTIAKRKELRSYLMLAFWLPEGIDENDFRRMLDNYYGIYVYFSSPGSPPSIRLGTIGDDEIFREGRVLATVACCAATFNQLGYKVDTGKAVDAAVEVLKAYPHTTRMKYEPIAWNWPVEKRYNE